MVLDLERAVDGDLRQILEAHRFDEARLRAHAARLAKEGFRPERAYLDRAPEPPPDPAFRDLPPPGSVVWAMADGIGREHIEEGGLACVILAGGMATRFGGVVKAATQCLRGRTFLDLKLADVGATSSRIPVAVLASYATEAAVRAELRGIGSDALVFTQSVSLRLTPEGTLFESGGRPSPYAPGHGDFLRALRDTGTLRSLRERGVRTLLVSNVDNLGASPDPVILGTHLSAGRPVTVEVVSRGRLDRGGAPALVGERVEVVEAFRFPPGIEAATFDTFNTNTFWLDAAALDRDFPLDEFAVRKEVDGRVAIQHESLLGQITHFLDAVYVRVARGGEEGRFLPVKDPEELAAQLPEIEARLLARGVLPETPR